MAWFGREQWQGFTSNHTHWHYAHKDSSNLDSLPLTTAVLASLMDIPLYHTATWEDSDFELIGQIIGEEIIDCLK